MKKLISVSTGEEVKLGSKLMCYVVTPIGNIPVNVIIVTEETIPYLIKVGAVKEVEVGEETPMDQEFYLQHLANRIGWNVDNLRKYLGNLYTIYPAAVFSIMLREVAIVLDDKDKNHIENSKEIYTISTLSGEIIKVKDLNHIKNFKNFAAFRTLEDAKKAKQILAEPMKLLFKRGGKQKDKV